jgi:uncharacterized protein
MNDIDATDIGAAPRPRPWGYWATFGWAILAAVLSAIIALLAVLWRRRGILSESIDLTNDGQLLSFMTTVSDAVQIGALAVAARLAQWPPGQYLGLIRPSGRDAALALGAVALYLPGFDALTYLLGRDIVTPFRVTSYLSARASGALPLLWFTFVVVAPAGEEIMFRGFLYRGWVRSQHAVVPVAVISALWAVSHVQYDWFGLLQIFLMGLLLGWARWRSGSAALTWLMHAIANLWAMLETVVKVQWRGFLVKQGSLDFSVLMATTSRTDIFFTVNGPSRRLMGPQRGHTGDKISEHNLRRWVGAWMPICGTGIGNAMRACALTTGGGSTEGDPPCPRARPSFHLSCSRRLRASCSKG